MTKTKFAVALIYFTTVVCLFEYIDFLSGLEPHTSHLKYALIAGTTLFGIACVLSFATLPWAAICALVAAAVSWPFLWRQLGMSFGRQWLWLITYYPNTPTAVFSLLVSSIYAIFQLRLLLSPAREVSERKVGWTLPVTVVYAVTMVAIANWPSIWSWCFKLRYGS